MEIRSNGKRNGVSVSILKTVQSQNSVTKLWSAIHSVTNLVLHKEKSSEVLKYTVFYILSPALNASPIVRRCVALHGIYAFTN